MRTFPINYFFYFYFYCSADLTLDQKPNKNLRKMEKTGQMELTWGKAQRLCAQVSVSEP